MKLVWSREAGRDRDDIFDYFAPQNLAAASATDTKIAAIEQRLLQFPASGRLGRVANTRELIIAGTPFVAIYGVADDRIIILRVIHGARQWPEDEA